MAQPMGEIEAGVLKLDFDHRLKLEFRMKAPAASKIITLPAFPEGGRQFEVRRSGWLETLKVTDNNGTLQFWHEGKLTHTIRLGKCFSSVG